MDEVAYEISMIIKSQLFWGPFFSAQEIFDRWRTLQAHRPEAFLLPAVFGYKASADVSTGQVRVRAANEWDGLFSIFVRRSTNWMGSLAFGKLTV